MTFLKSTLSKPLSEYGLGIKPEGKIWLKKKKWGGGGVFVGGGWGGGLWGGWGGVWGVGGGGGVWGGGGWFFVCLGVGGGGQEHWGNQNEKFLAEIGSEQLLADLERTLPV